MGIAITIRHTVRPLAGLVLMGLLACVPAQAAGYIPVEGCYLGGYIELDHLSGGDLDLFEEAGGNIVRAVDLLDQLAWLLEIAYLDDAIAHDPAQPFIRGGIKVLLRSLEQLTDVLAPPEPGTRRSGGRSSRAAGSQQTRGSQRATGDRSQTRSERRRRERG